jgi:septum formation protein
MLLEKIKGYKLILATQSPRRHFLMKEAGFNFEIKVPHGIEEVYPDALSETEIPKYLAELKASWFNNRLAENEIVITADTIVVLDNKVLGKPTSYDDAIQMLQSLSGRPHDVVTGVCLLSKNKKYSFSAFTKVWFRNLTNEEIKFYVDTYKPFDKAGSYGAQEWIGYIGIEHIEGSYFNVMGLPIQMVYNELERFIS